MGMQDYSLRAICKERMHISVSRNFSIHLLQVHFGQCCSKGSVLPNLSHPKSK